MRNDWSGGRQESIGTGSLAGLIQEPCRSPRKEALFSQILEVSLLTSAPTLPRYLESALGLLEERDFWLA